MIIEYYVFKFGYYYLFISIGCSLLFGCERIGRFYLRLVFKYFYYNLNFRLFRFFRKVCILLINGVCISVCNFR